MPYTFDERMPEWEKYIERYEEGDYEDPPMEWFRYELPFNGIKTSVVNFPKLPGPEPVKQPFNWRGPNASLGFFARLFGKKPTPPTPQELEQQRQEHLKWQEAVTAHELWEISMLAEKCRNLGVSRVFGFYNGGDDENVTYFLKIEMSDGAYYNASMLPLKLKPLDFFELLIVAAVYYFLGNDGTGQVMIFGVIEIDVEACTIKDEQDKDIVFEAKLALGL